MKCYLFPIPIDLKHKARKNQLEKILEMRSKSNIKTHIRV